MRAKRSIQPFGYITQTAQTGQEWTDIHNHRRLIVSGRSSTILEQSARQRHVSQFVVGFVAATETHTVPAFIPRHYHVTFLNCNTHSGLAVALLLSAVLGVVIVSVRLCIFTG